MVCRGSDIRGSPDAAKDIFVPVTLTICLKQMFRESEKMFCKNIFKYDGYCHGFVLY